MASAATSRPSKDTSTQDGTYRTFNDLTGSLGSPGARMHAQHVQGLCASQGPSALFLAGVCLYSALPTVLLPTAHAVLPTDDTRASC